MATSATDEAEDDAETFEVEVHTERRQDYETVTIEADSRSEALKKASDFEAWEIGANGRFHDGFKHFMVFAPSLEEAESKLLEQERKADSIIDNSQFKLGDVTGVEIRGDAR